MQRGSGSHPDSGTKSQRTGDTGEVWVRSELPRVPRKQTVAGAGSRTWSFPTSLDQQGPGGKVRIRKLKSFLREAISPEAQRGSGRTRGPGCEANVANRPRMTWGGGGIEAICSVLSQAHLSVLMGRGRLAERGQG